MTAETKIITEKFKTENDWISAARSAKPEGGRLKTQRGYQGGLSPAFLVISVYDASGSEVAEVRWDRT